MYSGLQIHRKSDVMTNWIKDCSGLMYRQEYSGIFEPLPQHPGTRLMFYLNCVNKVLDIRDADTIEKLIDYERFFRLSNDEIDKLIIMAIALAPNRLVNHCFIESAEMCGDLQNEFHNKEDLAANYKINDFVTIGEDSRTIFKIMSFKPQYLKDNYYTPLKSFKSRIRSIAEELDDAEKSTQKVKEREQQKKCFCTVI